MIKAAFVGFGEVNSPRDIIVNKCSAAAESLKKEGFELAEVFPVSDDYEKKDVKNAIAKLKTENFDLLILCLAGWIPSHAVVDICEEFREKPMVLWGLCGYYENGRLITTADQAGTTALRKTFYDLGYNFKYFYDIVGCPSKASAIYSYGIAAAAAVKLRRAKIGMGGYRDMMLYGTMFDGASLKREIGPDVESFELLEIERRSAHISDPEKNGIVDYMVNNWRFMKEPSRQSLLKAAELYIAIRNITRERNFEAVSLKDVDGMKKLFGFPPAPVFMLLADIDGLCTIPENDSLGLVTQLMVKYLTGQPAAYLEFYEFFEDRVLAGVPDYVPAGVVDGDIKIMPAAFGELSEGLLNVSSVRQGKVTLCRLTSVGDRYYMHMVCGEGITPRGWEEAGWTQPAPQLPGLEILLDNTADFTDNVMSQHYIISYGDNRGKIKDLCGILGVDLI